MKRNVYYPILHYIKPKKDDVFQKRLNVNWDPLDGLNAWKPALIVSVTDEWRRRVVKSRVCSLFQKRPALLCQGCYLGTHLIKDCNKFALKTFNRPVVKAHIKLFTRIAQNWFKAERITEVEVEKANGFVDDLANFLSDILEREIRFKPFGSLISGFGAKNADLDLCVCLKQKVEQVSSVFLAYIENAFVSSMAVA